MGSPQLVESHGDLITPALVYSDSSSSPMSYDERETTVPISVLLSYTIDDVGTKIVIDAVDVQGQNMTTGHANVPSYANLEASTSHQYAGNSPDSGYEDNSPSCGVLLVEEEPETSYRFRYLKESVKPHGPLKGEFSEGKSPKNSSGPKVKLHNFKGEAIIRAWNYEETLKDGPSPHRLLSTRIKGRILDEPHEVVVNAENNYTACFNRLNIVHVVQKEKEYQQCYLRKKAGLAQRFGDKLIRNIPDTSNYSFDTLKKEWKKKNKNICSLYFEAFEKRGSDYYYIANAISRPIKNKKSPKTNDLKVVRSSHAEGSALGGDAVLIFTEKLVKEIRIVFTDDDDDWEADAVFEEKDIHKQVAVAFKTPPYKNVNISEPVTAYFHIVRTTDNAESEHVKFRYLPARRDTPEIQSPKRRRAQGEFVAPVEASMPYSSAASENPMLTAASVLVEPVPSYMDASCSNLSDGYDPELLAELLQYDSTDSLPYRNVIDFQMTYDDDLEQVSTGDLVKDNMEALDAYRNWDRDSTPQAQGPRVLRGGALSPASNPQSMPAFERARHLHASILRNDMREFVRHLATDTVNYKINSKTPLHLAVQHERTAMVNKLLGANADPYALDGVQSNTPVHVAIMSSPLSLHILMSSAISPLSVFNKDGDDPLLFSVRNGKLDAVKLLLKKGFSLDSSNVKDGDGPLHVASQIKHEKIRHDMVCLLLKHGASVSRRNGAGFTALDVANAHPQPDDLIDKLSHRLSEENDEEDSDDGDVDLTKKMDSLCLRQAEQNVEHSSEGIDDSSESAAPEPYLALDGDVETSKKVADLTQCAFLKPILIGAQKHSQVLLKQLERKMSPAQAVKTLNDAYARAKGL